MFNQITRIFRKYPVYCGWCGVYLHDSEAENSTGICKSCKKEMGY